MDPDLERILRQWDEARQRRNAMLRGAWAMSHHICAAVGFFSIALMVCVAVRMMFDA